MPWRRSTASCPSTERRSAPVRTSCVEFEVGQSVVLEAHEGYHRGAPATPTMNFVIITDLVAAASALAAGQVDYVEEMTPDAFEAVRNAENVKIAEYPGFLHLELQFNVREGRIFSDVNLRKAMQLCIDKAGTVDAATNGTALPTESETPPASWAFNPDVQGVERDVDAAQGPHRGVGLDDGRRRRSTPRTASAWPPRCSCGPVSATGSTSCSCFAEQVRECGVRDHREPGRLPDGPAAGARPGVGRRRLRRLLRWLVGGARPGSVQPLALQPGQSTEERPELFNYIGYCNAEVDEIIEAGLATSDQEERRELYFRFQEILAEEQPYLFAYAPLVRDGMHRGMTFTDGEFNLESPTWLWQRHKIVIPES